jgi:hypothetical protein
VVAVVLKLHVARPAPVDVVARPEVEAGRFLDVLRCEHHERPIGRPSADVDEPRYAGEQQVVETVRGSVTVLAVAVQGDEQGTLGAGSL